MSVRFLTAGDAALVVEFGDRIDRAVSDEVVQLDRRVQQAAPKGLVESVPTFRSLMVHYDPLATSGDDLEAALRALLEGERDGGAGGRLWRVPACYDGEFAPDLEDVARETGLSRAEVVALHAAGTYHVYMIGFVPGFPYMGDLDERLRLPRLKSPRTRVPPGSVAIATSMTAVYPIESPGGWRLIGATPIRLFDPAAERPALFAPGDAVRFEPVPRDVFDEVKSQVARGAYETPHEERAA